MPKMAATPMIMWKWPTTKEVSWKYRSSAGWPRKIPLSPPVTNSDTKPRANIMAVVKRILPPHKVPIQLNVLMADGTPMAMVSTENAIAEYGLMRSEEHTSELQSLRHFEQPTLFRSILPPHKVPIQLNVLMADGTPMAMVSTENAIAEYGLMPLMNRSEERRV